MRKRIGGMNPLAGLLLTVGLTGAAQAALIDRGGGLIYDTVLNVTWLQDANYAKTSGYDADGLMTWSQATTWAANLSYYDSVRNVTYSDWRLPTVTPVNGTSFQYWNGSDYWTGARDESYNVSAPGSAHPGSTASELAYMYYVNLGNLSYFSTTGSNPQAGWGLTHTGPFINLQADHYWTGTEYARNAYYDAWGVYFGSGGQLAELKTYDIYAWAVRPGDVATVPEADTWAMMLGGLALVTFASRRRVQVEVLSE